MIPLIAILLFLIFIALSSLHFYWALGGLWASDAVIPTKEDDTKLMSPSIWATLTVAVALLSFGLFILIKAGLINFDLPLWIEQYGLWIIASIFSLRAIGEFNYVGFFKKYRQTTFGQNDTRFYTPLCLMIGLLTIIIALNT
jgi:hypothetical protein